MPLNDRELAYITVGISLASLILFIAWHQSGQPTQSRYELDSNPNLSKVIPILDTGEHYFHPAYCIPGQNVVFTQHRYPSQSGINANVLMSRGLNAMTLPAPQDDDWRQRPPGEVDF